MALAWQIECLARKKTLPALSSLLTRRQRQQTAREQRTVLHILSEQYGIPLRTRTKSNGKTR